MPELIAREVWSKLGTEDDAYIALDGAGSAQLDGGFCCSLRDLARFGLMLLQGGSIGGRRVVPAWWIDDIRTNGDTAAFAAAPDCGLLPRGWSYRSGFWVGGAHRSHPVHGTRHVRPDGLRPPRGRRGGGQVLESTASGR